MDISDVHPNHLDAIARRLNERPRQTLNFETPAERFSQYVAWTGWIHNLTRTPDGYDSRTEMVKLAVKDRKRGKVMKRSVRAALLSGLVFPGVGHMALKRYLRGSVLMLAALVALSVIVTKAIERALTIVDRINNGDIPLDPEAISELVSKSTGGAEESVLSIAGLIIGACWLIGIIDSYRLGNIQEKELITAAKKLPE